MYVYHSIRFYKFIKLYFIYVEDFYYTYVHVYMYVCVCNNKNMEI